MGCVFRVATPCQRLPIDVASELFTAHFGAAVLLDGLRTGTVAHRGGFDVLGARRALSQVPRTRNDRFGRSLPKLF